MLRIWKIELAWSCYIAIAKASSFLLRGKGFAHHARLVISQLEHLNNDLQEYGKDIKGYLQLFASSTAATEFLPHVLNHYLTAHPDVNVDLREKPSSDFVRAVGDGQADLGIISGRTRTEGLEVRRYREDRLVLVIPKDHALAACHKVEFADALSYDHIGVSSMQFILRLPWPGVFPTQRVFGIGI